MQLIKGDANNERSAVIKNGMDRPIRKLEATEAKAGIARALQAVCSVYGLESPSGEVLSICVDTIQKQFAAIGVGEIIHATQLHASGIIAQNAKFYAKLNVKALGEILTDYIEYRRAIVFQIAEEKAAAERVIQDAARAAAMQEAYYKAFPELLANFAGSWDEIPVHWYDTAIKLCLMAEPEPDYKREIWQRAKDLARIESERESKDETNVFKLKGILKSLEQADGLDGKAVAISKKLIVHEKLIKCKK